MKPFSVRSVFVLVAAVSSVTVGRAESQPPAAVEPQPAGRAIFGQDGGVHLPSAYRSWQHVGTRVKTGGDSVLDGTKIVAPQVMDTYVEPGAFAAFRRLGKWPDGTQIVKEFSILKTGEGCNATSFVCTTPYGLGLFESHYIGAGMMVKDSTRFGRETGYWGYFSFTSEGSRYSAVSPVRSRAQCSSCHEALAAGTDYVFSSTHIGLLPENLH